MTQDQNQPDDAAGAEVAWIFERSSTAPELRAEFVRTLSDRLDAGFAARPSKVVVQTLHSANVNGHTNGKGAAIKALANGAAVNGHAEKKPELPQAEAAVSTSSTGRTCSNQTLRRWTMMLIAAASLFMAFVVWGPAYGWTAAIRQWVMAIVPISAGGSDAGSGQAVTATSQDDRPDVALVTTEFETETHGVQPAVKAQEMLTELTPAVEQATPSNAKRVVAENVVALAEDGVAPKVEPVKKAYEAEKPERPKTVLPPWKPFDEALPSEELSQRIDEELAAMWQAKGIRVSAPADDVEFMRRVYLDLTGRIPSVSEVHDFLSNKTPDRREQLIDKLLAHRDHATHLAAVWREILLPSGVDVTRLGGSAKFDEWLAERFGANKPYDQIVRDLLQAEGRVAGSGPLLFYSSMRLNPEELAGKSARAFLGVRMECAQCHNHPFDESVSQQDFWGFAAFFARISRPKGKMDVTSPVLQVRDNKQGEVMLPQSEKVIAPRLPLTDLEVDDGPDGPPRRQQLVDWLTSKNNGQFARATVNRVWAHLFGRGLVEPVDDMRPANPAISSEVLDTLSKNFAASNFDLRQLIRGIVMTKAYQLSSKSEEADPSRALCFAQMNIKSFTAEQLYDCITIATRQSSGQTVAAVLPDGTIGVDRFQDVNRQQFIDQFRAPPGMLTDYHGGIPQALTLMHGGLIHGATDLSSSGLLKSLAAPFFKDQERLDTLFLSTLSRHPQDVEREVMLAQLGKATNAQERQQVLGDVLWALLNSGEFTFNH